jgi:hypothetical protein
VKDKPFEKSYAEMLQFILKLHVDWHHSDTPVAVLLLQQANARLKIAEEGFQQIIDRQNSMGGPLGSMSGTGMIAKDCLSQLQNKEWLKL